MPTALKESRALTAEAVAGKPGRFSVQIINPGWGSSGYYSPQVLEAAARDGIFKAGTKAFLDHPSESEAYDRPERSVRDIAGVLTEDARWTGDALVSEMQVFGPYREVLAEMKDAIGLSIRAAAEVTEAGEAEGRRGRIIDRLVEASSVDFVTAAGRGGKILAVLESARAIEAGRMDSDRQEAFRQAVLDAYAGDGNDIWIRDFDDTDVYFERYGDDQAGTYRQAYSEDAGTITLTGEPVAVTARTTYVPVDAAESAPIDLTREAALARVSEARNVGTWIESRLHLSLTQIADEMFGDGRLTREERIALSGAVGDGLTAFTAALEQSAPQLYARDLWSEPEQVVAAATESVPVLPAGQSTTQESEEDTMPEIAEAELTRLREDAGRVQTLESERDAATRRATEAEHRLREADARNQARPIATEIVGASESLPPSTRIRVIEAAVAGVQVGENGAFDEAAFRTTVEAARTQAEAELAEALQAAGVGRVRGVGHTSGIEQSVSEADLDALDDAVFGEIKEA